MILSDAYNDRVQGIIERLSDEELANEWKALLSLEAVYFDEHASGQLLVDEIGVAMNSVSNECARRFCNKVNPEAASEGTR